MTVMLGSQFSAIIFSLFSFMSGEPMVENTQTPEINKPISCVVDLQLGTEDGRPEEMFSSNIRVAVTPNDEIAILDSSAAKVLLFKPDGTFITSFGKKGQGPGEFQAPSNLAIDKEGNIWVFDAMVKSISIFDSKGKWIENRKLPQNIVAVISPQILDSGLLVLTAVKLDEQFQQAYVLGTMGKDEGSFKSYVSLPTPKMDWNKMGEPGFWEGFLTAHFNAIGKGFPLSVGLGNQFVACNTSSYRATCYDLEGNPVWSMTKENKPRINVEEAKRALCEAVYDGVRSSGPVGNMLNDSIFESAYRKAELPEFMLPIESLFAWDKGFGVLTNYDTVRKNGTLQLFDSNGHFLLEGPYEGPANIRLLKNDKLYAFGLDEDDVMKVTRFKIKGL